MRVVTITANLSIDDSFLDWDNQEEKEWLLYIMKNTELILHSQEIGDSIGDIKILDMDLYGAPK